MTETERLISQALDCLTVVVEGDDVGIEVREALRNAQAWIAVALVADEGREVA